MALNIIDIAIEGIKLFILLLIILIIILFNKKISKKSTVEKKNFLWKGVLIWTLFYMFFSIVLIIGSSLVISMTGVFPRIGSLILAQFIPYLLIGFFSGWLMMLLFLRKIKKPVYIGATVGFLISLLSGFIPGFNFFSSLVWKLFNINIVSSKINELIFAIVSPVLVLVVLGGIIGFIINKLRNKNVKRK